MEGNLYQLKPTLLATNFNISFFMSRSMLSITSVLISAQLQVYELTKYVIKLTLEKVLTTRIEIEVQNGKEVFL